MFRCSETEDPQYNGPALCTAHTRGLNEHVGNSVVSGRWLKLGRILHWQNTAHPNITCEPFHYFVFLSLIGLTSPRFPRFFLPIEYRNPSWEANSLSGTQICPTVMNPWCTNMFITACTEKVSLSRCSFLFGRYSVRNSAGTPVTLTEVFYCFTQSLQANTGIEPRLGHDRSLPSPFRFIINHLSYYSTQYCLYIYCVDK
jgi:hypothetical protein